MSQTKKVGICACYDSRNYGSMLQAYATQVAVTNLGYKSEFIVYKKKKDLLFMMKQIPRLFNRNLLSDKLLGLKKKTALRKHPQIQEKESIRQQAFVRFQKEYYKSFSETYYGYDALKEGARNYGTVLVGSDQLWTPGGLASNFYNLMFVPDEVNKVSYATSFGVSSIPWYQKKRTYNYLIRINHLSVRELKGAEIVKEIANRNAAVVADPTLLLTKEDWEQCIPVKTIVQKPYIFCYFLGENPEHRTIANELKEKTGLDIVCTPFLDSFVESDQAFGDKQLFDIGPHDFINLIRNAEYVLTDSFHGSVFSIIHHKKFVVFNRYSEGDNSRNSRIDSLLSILGLESRRYKKDVYNEIMQDIDYNSVDSRRNNLRTESEKYLKAALESN